MADFYALPALTTWAQIGGWSNTSGGASNGTYPSVNTDNIIFDSNSGPSRSITFPNGINCGSMICTGAPMTIISTNGEYCYLSASFLNLSGFSQIYTSAGLTPTTTSGAVTILGPTSGSISGLNCQQAGVTLAGNLIVTGAIVMGTYNFNANGYNVSAAYINDANANSGTPGQILTTGSGTWTFTGTQQCITLNYAGLNMANTTFKFASAGTLTFSQTPLSTNTLWVASGTAIVGGGSFSVNKIQVDGGAVLQTYLNTTITAKTWQIKGSPSSKAGLYCNSASSNYGTSIVNGTTGTKVYLDFCNVFGMHGDGTFTARSSTDQGYNQGIPFLKLLPNFLSFF